jgi:hypothetical protein
MVFSRLSSRSGESLQEQCRAYIRIIGLQTNTPEFARGSSFTNIVHWRALATETFAVENFVEFNVLQLEAHNGKTTKTLKASRQDLKKWSII